MLCLKGNFKKGAIISSTCVGRGGGGGGCKVLEYRTAAFHQGEKRPWLLRCITRGRQCIIFSGFTPSDTTCQWMGLGVSGGQNNKKILQA